MMILFFAVCSAQAKNPVLVDDLGTGDYPNIRNAIRSFCAGNENSAETPPFVIQVINGPYDETINIDQTVGNTGNIVGDLIIEAVGSPVTLTCKPANVQGALRIVQDTHNVTIKNFVLAVTADANSSYSVQSVVYLNETTTANTDVNTFTFENCVITESDPEGNPLVTTKQEALLAGYPTNPGTKRAPACRGVRKASRAGGSLNYVMKNCAVYGSKGYGSESNMNNADEEITWDNTLVAWSGMDGHRFFVGSVGKPGYITFTGNDQTAGALDCNAIIGFGQSQPAGDDYGGEGISLQIGDAGAGMQCLVEKTIIANDRDDIKSKGIQDYEGSISSIPMSSNTSLTVRDTIISVAGYGMVIGPDNNASFSDVTFQSNSDTLTGAGAIQIGSDATGSLSLTDCIFSGNGTAFLGSVPSGGVSVNYSALVSSGPDALVAQDEGQGISYGANLVTADPEYLSYDVTGEPFMDVSSLAYQAAGFGGSALAGGADFVAPPATPTASSSVDLPWEVYE